MDIQKAEIRYLFTDSFDNNRVENVQVVKALPWLSVVQAVEGSYDIQIGDRAGESVGEGGFFIAPAGIRQNIVHHVRPSTGVMCARWLFLDVVLNDTNRPDFFYDFPTVFPQSQQAAMNAIFDRLFAADHIFARCICGYQVLKLLLSVAREKGNDSDESMAQIFDFIHQNYAKEIRIATMADTLHMSESNFYTVFKKHFGMSPIAYINQLRITLAEEQLRNTNRSIAEIAESVGIRDPLYFSKLFRRTYQCPPLEYRRKNRKSPR